MAITKVDVKKKLFVGGDPVHSGKVNQKHTNTRPTRFSKNQKQSGTVNLARMSSASFNELIGEGPRSSVIQTNKGLKTSKKTADTVKMQMLLNLNANVLHADGVNVDEEATPQNDEDGKVKDTASALTPCDEGAKEKETQETVNKETVNKETVNKQTVNKDTVNKETVNKETDNKETVTGKDGHDIGSNSPGGEMELDNTLPLFISEATQTEGCYILCSCNNCKDLVRNFSNFLNKGFSTDNCQARKSPQGTNESFSLNFSNKEEEVELVPLFKGASVKISVTAKGKLKSLDRNSEAVPKDYVYAIMDDLYEPKVMANMTAAGRTKGSIAMDKKIRDTILIYLQNKYEDVTSQLIHSHINDKCYAERRKLWGKDEVGVRKPLTKNIKKKTEGGKEDATKTNKTGDEARRKKKKKSKKHGKKSVREEKSHMRRRKAITPEKVKGMKRKESTKVTEEKKMKNPRNENRCPYSPGHKKRENAPLSHEPVRFSTGGKRPKTMEEIKRMMSELSDEDSETAQKRFKPDFVKSTNKYLASKKLPSQSYSIEKNLNSSTPMRHTAGDYQAMKEDDDDEDDEDSSSNEDDSSEVDSSADSSDNDGQPIDLTDEQI